MIRIPLLALCFFLIIGLAATVADDSPEVVATMRAGMAVLEENCMECHGLNWPLDKVADRQGWETILTMMANTGAVVARDDRAKLMEYLVAKSTFQRQCALCHDLDRSLARKLSYGEWLETVNREVARRPGLLVADEVAGVAGFLTVGM